MPKWDAAHSSTLENQRRGHSLRLQQRAKAGHFFGSALAVLEQRGLWILVLKFGQGRQLLELAALGRQLLECRTRCVRRDQLSPYAYARGLN